ncbi:MAG: hypothetical protein U0X39_10220 [Bacteroidales bacterium]
MTKIASIVRNGFFCLLIVLFASSGCATQNPYAKKRSKASHVNTSQLGRNKYYFSTGYQKRLVKSVKK